MTELLTSEQINAALTELPSWQLRGSAIIRAVTAPAFLTGIRIIDDVAEVAEELNHHPDIDVRWTTVTFALSTHSKGGLTANDFELARRIDAVCSRHSAS